MLLTEDEIKNNILKSEEECKRTLLYINEKLSEEIEKKKEARKEGDLRENSAYNEAVDAIVLLTADTIKLKQRLKGYEEYNEITKNLKYNPCIGIGSYVTVKYKGTNEIYNFIIVPDNAGSVSKTGALGTDSPLGKMLLGHKEGDIIFIDSPVSNNLEYQIVSVGGGSK